MTPYIAEAAERHALAICAWSMVDQAANPEVQARRVATARQCSQTALDLDPATDQTANIQAAMTDAETEAAIQAHATAIVSLAMETGE